MTGHDVFEAAGQRARWLRALLVGSLVLAGSAIASAAATLLGRLCFDWFVSLSLAAVLVGASWLLSISAFILSHRRRPDLPLVLLRMDYRMGLDARLSALYELEMRSPTSFLRRRLELSLAEWFPQWRNGLPVSNWSVAGLTVGVLATAGVLVLGALGGISEVSTGDLAAGFPDEGVFSANVLPAGEHLGDDVENAQIASSNEVGGLEGLLTELGRKLNQVETEDIETAIEFGWDPEFQMALETWLTQLQERLVRTESPLTAEERSVLATVSAEAPPSVKEALDEILEAATTTEVNQAMRGLLDALQLPEAAEEEGVSESMRAPEESVSTQSGDSTKAPVAMPDTGAPGGSPTAQPEEGDAAQASERTSEASVSSSPSDPTSASYVREDAPPSVSEEGEVRAYLTLGVPIELEPKDDGTSSPRVDYEKLDSILESRNLPASAADIVREYFESISEGGS